ncbi:hypothetical protein LAZ67_11000718 [Cordylochernes scorpioides]|uniref:Reverse transcriptase Ty1/copia-type domain-containing protein n=1 Tax=Cordylochernes scorpioides TaxID=51811 RepID=A0ABY6KXV9_9ARAC|nr:hypothetical protein LAZ67_11000718 [Cordylochernes scorpioides]
MGFTRLESCNCIYTYLDKAIIAGYVDDLVLFGESEEILRNIEQKINERFRVKNLGAIRNFLGVQIDYPDEETLVLSQSTYVKSILQKFNMIECRPVSTPLFISFPISKGDCPTDEEEKERMRAIPYRELIGSLLYLANCTRPDLMFSVTRLAQFSSNPGRRHWQAAKHVLRYLHGSINLSLVYRRTDSNDACAYSDADWASDIDDRRSNSGTAITIGHSLVIWKTCKQKNNSGFDRKSPVTKRLVKVKRLLKELKVKLQYVEYDGYKNIANLPLIDSENIYLPPLHIKLGLIKNFVKAMDRNASGFAYLKQKNSSISEAKIKEGIFVGPQIRELQQDGNFLNSLNEVEVAAWNSFRKVCKIFLGSVKVENYRDIVNDLLLSYKALGCNMSLKIHFLHSHLDFFPDKLGAVSDEHGERFHQDISSMEKRYQGKWSPAMLADYCWTLKRDLPQAKY